MLIVDDLPELRKLYDKAKAENKESFMFQGHELLVSYVRYLIEYLESFGEAA